MGLQVNPQVLINMIRSGQNPQQLMLSVLENNMSSTPMGRNIMDLAKSGNNADLEKIARNVAQQRGINYDEAMGNLKRMLGM